MPVETYADGRESRPIRVRTDPTFVEEPVRREGKERVEEDEKEESKENSRSRVTCSAGCACDGKRAKAYERVGSCA